MHKTESTTEKRPATPMEALAGSGFSRVADASQSDGNAIELLRDGPEVFPRWLGAIADAQRTVHLENYILEEDATGGAFAAALIQAASRGVHCRVLYDWLGCRRRTSPAFWQKLRNAGVEVRCYNRPRFGHLLGWISRDHRKVLCVDGEIAFTGGLCIGHDWQGNPFQDIPPWRDTAIAVRGPAVAEVPGSRVHDEILPGTAADAPIPLARPTNNAGGLEGGVTNGQDLRVTAYMKPISTLMKPLRSVDLTTMTVSPAAIERSDVCAVPAAAVVGEAMVAIVLADALIEKFGGDSIEELVANWKTFTARTAARFAQR